jgi:hypothetical protein
MLKKGALLEEIDHIFNNRMNHISLYNQHWESAQSEQNSGFRSRCTTPWRWQKATTLNMNINLENTAKESHLSTSQKLMQKNYSKLATVSSSLSIVHTWAWSGMINWSKLENKWTVSVMHWRIAFRKHVPPILLRPAPCKSIKYHK